MLYWITSTLATTPAFLLVYFGVGIPWALALLPREDWSRRSHVAVVAILSGATLLTLWMFVLGTLGAATESPLLRANLILLGMIGLALVGGGIAFLRARRASPMSHTPRTPFAWDERLLIVLIGVALVVRWFVIAYWPFTAYDALWVYGYEGRLYAVEGLIPNTIAYYPQFMPLQYTFGYLMVGGIDDHGARAGLIVLHVASIFAVYVLGARLFARRTGVIAAALWTLYPHVGEWSRAGDLEIVVATCFALAAAFFLLAWLGDGNEPQRRRYALLAGLIFGVGLWTKPTMGAFIYGLALAGFVELIRVRFQWRIAWQRGQYIALTLLAAVPLGGVWYVRNLLLGYPAIDLPPSYWLTQAMRSGSEFGWLLLALALLLLYLLFAPARVRPNLVLLLAGAVLIAVGVAPSILDPHRMGALEWAALAAGVLLLARGLWPYYRAHASNDTRRDVTRLGWALLLALPYFVTWFYSYSYHYRLSFPIVPLLLLPTAVLLARWTASPIWVQGGQRLLAGVGLVAIGMPGIVAAIYDVDAGWDYLWSGELPDDRARYAVGNPALLNVVNGLQVWIDEHPDERLHVFAPGVDRLPFFFPSHTVDVESTPTRLNELNGAAYLVYGVPETQGRYEPIPVTENQVVGSLGRQDVMRRAWGMDDGQFRYDVFELFTAQRFTQPFINGAAPADVTMGGIIRYLGYDIGTLEFWQGRRIIAHFYWQPLTTTESDYSILIHLVDSGGNLIADWDGPIALTPRGYYATTVWEPGEIISDERDLTYEQALPLGEGYQLQVGLYDPATDERLPVSVNGEIAGDTFTIPQQIRVVPPPNN